MDSGKVKLEYEIEACGERKRDLSQIPKQRTEINNRRSASPKQVFPHQSTASNRALQWNIPGDQFNWRIENRRGQKGRRGTLSTRVCKQQRTVRSKSSADPKSEGTKSCKRQQRGRERESERERDQ